MDARNHGDSPHDPDMSYEAMSQDIQELLSQLGLVPSVLIGHSMGGKTAMLLALQRVSTPSSRDLSSLPPCVAFQYSAGSLEMSLKPTTGPQAPFLLLPPGSLSWWIA